MSLGSALPWTNGESPKKRWRYEAGTCGREAQESPGFSRGEDVKYFQATYLPHSDELTRRCVFVRRADGAAVGTITSWWNMTDERRDPSVHWLAVRPDYQGLGLGKALVSECLKRLVWLEGDRNIFLHTQTWSHRAIAIYIKAGFEFVGQGSFGGYPNAYEQAMPVLRSVLPSLVR